MLARTLLLAFAFVSVAQAETVKAVFKSNSVIASQDMKRFTFGLSPAQVNGILQLTGGKVNFGNVHYTEVDSDALGTFSSQAGFSGVLYPNVPPPKKPRRLNVVTSANPDPELKDQWWLLRLNVQEAWLKATGKGVVIADCDAGFYHDELDLNANMLLDYRYDLSDSANPLVVNDGPYAYHGTAVTAIIAGVQNAAGTNGIAFDSKIVPLQNFNYDDKDKANDKEEMTAACVLRAINTPNVNVIVLENQTATGSSETFVGTRDAVRLAIQSGITVVGAGGNYTKELIEEAKDDTGSIIVGALAVNGDPAYFTNFGARLTVGAFGEKLHTLYGPNGLFGEFGGTSGATPQVAATVALMKEANPLLTPQQIRELLLQTRKLNAVNEKAGGQLDTLAAVDAAIAARPNITAFAEQQAFRAQLSAILSQ